MKKAFSFLMVLCLLCAVAQASAEMSAVFEGAWVEPTNCPDEGPASEPQAVLPMTAQRWIPNFLTAAEEQGLVLEENFLYIPVHYTGQHIYLITFAEEPNHVLSMSVLGQDGVSIEACSMRLASAMLPSGELMQATDKLWQAVRAMVMASDPEASGEEMDALCEALCPDLPAALLCEDQVETVYTLRGLSYELWGSKLTEAFLDGSDTWVDGYIVDFVVRADVPDVAE